MIWRILALIGAGSFFVVGWNIFIDPQCKSVNFSGGGAHTVVTTCLPDSSGDFSKSTAAGGSLLIGIALLAWLFWPHIRNYMANSQMQSKLNQFVNETKAEREIQEGQQVTPNEKPSGLSPTISSYTDKFRQNKLLASVLALILIFGFYKIVAPKIEILNSITCASLKKEVSSRDKIGRELWNSYQNEVSNLSLVEMYSDAYYLQVGNAARRALQLEMNDQSGYLLLHEKPHCVKDNKSLNLRISSTSTIINYLNGSGMITEKRFSVDNGWNVDFYNAYLELSNFIK